MSNHPAQTPLLDTTRGFPTVALPADHLPPMTSAGKFWHRDRDFGVCYNSPTHAVHLYEYPCTMRWCGLDRQIAPGDLTITPAGWGSRYHLPRDGRHWCVHFRPLPATQSSLRLPLMMSLGRDIDAVTERFAAISHRWSAARAPGTVGAAAALAAGAAFHELLCHLALLAEGTPSARLRAERAADAVAELLERRLAQPISIPRLCREVGVSQNHLAATFRRRFGVTMPRFLLQRRIERATFLLTTTDQSVAQVAAAVGMPDAQHFASQFRRLTGRTPSAARVP